MAPTFAGLLTQLPWRDPVWLLEPHLPRMALRCCPAPPPSLYRGRKHSPEREHNLSKATLGAAQGFTARFENTTSPSPDLWLLVLFCCLVHNRNLSPRIQMPRAPASQAAGAWLMTRSLFLCTG